MTADWVVVLCGYALCAAVWAGYTVLLHRGRRHGSGPGSGGPG